MMKMKAISQMPVFSGKKVIGTITESHVMSLVSSAVEPRKVLCQKVEDHILLVFASVGRDTPVGALYSLFRYMPAVLVVAGETVEGVITKTDLLASGA